jgi:hypothetical protein
MDKKKTGLSLFAQNLFQTFGYVHDAGTPQTVKNVLPSPLVSQDTGIFQDRQMAGQGGHVHVKHFK